MPSGIAVAQALKNGAIHLTLNMAGTEISPTKLTSFSDEKNSAWSVHFKNEGQFQGIITSETTPTEKVVLEQVGENSIYIDVYEPLFSKKNILSFFGILLGPLISIPGLLAFLRERRREKEEKRKEDESNRKIIIP